MMGAWSEALTISLDCSRYDATGSYVLVLPYVRDSSEVSSCVV